MTKAKRLVDLLKPSLYELFISIDEKDMKFYGRVSITAEKLISSNEIILHAADLEIKSAEISHASSKQMSNFEYDESQQELTLKVDEVVKTGEISINIEFSANITESMVGLYPSKFKKDGKEKLLFSTQLEGHHAREMFPCIDEPSAKAIFELTIEFDESATVISNTEEVEHKVANKRKTTKFGKTPLMSSYLLAFVAGDIKYLEAKTSSGIKIKTWATPNHYKNTEFALECAVKAFDLLEKFFDVPYPLEKCDLVAIPEFAAGAMENWGLITYRESDLIIDEHSKLAERQRVAAVTAHELAHQWFGNLVTMAWWNDLWLNESFASFMEVYIPNKIFPKWNLWADFVAYDYSTAQGLDRLKSTHAIEVDIDSPAQIRTMFDAISYEKGSIIIRMILGFIGEEAFRTGLQNYMKKHKYGNTTTEDLWNAWSQSSGLDVVTLAKSWTTQEGFPIVSLVSDNEHLSLSQKRYLLHPDKTNKQLWQIPIRLDDKLLVFDQVKRTLQSRPNDTINSGHVGFYITDYDEGTLSRISANFEKLEEEEKIGLINDLFESSKSGDTPLDLGLNSLELLSNQNGSALWAVASGELGSLRYNFVDAQPTLEATFNKYIESLIKHSYDRLAWNMNKKDSIDDELLRPIIIGQAIDAKIPIVLKEAETHLQKTQTAEDLPPHLRTILLRHLSKSNPDSFKKLRRDYNMQTSPGLRRSLGLALISTQDRQNIDACIEMITEQEVRLQDVLSWIAGLLSNHTARDTAWQWLRNNWPYLKKRYGSNDMSLAYIPVIAGSRLTSTKQLEEYRYFFNKKDFSFIYNKVEQGEEVLSWKVNWIQENTPLLKDWLARQN